MATVRYSSIWDRWRADESSYEQWEFDDWMLINYPDAMEQDGLGGYVLKNDNMRNWSINPNSLAEIVWLFLSGELDGLGGKTAAQNAAEYFSLSDHEVLQMSDIKDWILLQGNAAAQKAAWNTLKCWMNSVEQHGAESKTFIYNKFSIRADVAAG